MPIHHCLVLGHPPSSFPFPKSENQESRLTFFFLLPLHSLQGPLITGHGPPTPHTLHPSLPTSVLPTSNLWKMVGAHGLEGRRGAEKPRQVLPLPSKNNPLFPFLPSPQEHSRIQEWEELNGNPPHSGRPMLTFCSLGSGMTRVRAA